MYYLLNAESLAAALGGDVVGPNQVKAPGPNHSPKDRSLSVKMEPSAPGGLLIYSFADDSTKSAWIMCTPSLVLAAMAQISCHLR